MRSSLTSAELAAYTSAQLEAMFPDGDRAVVTAAAVDQALGRVHRCFSATRQDCHLWDGDDTLFNHLHSDAYAMYLYLLANTLHAQDGAGPLCDKLFLLNKALHGIDLLYSVRLPEVFLLVHPVGTVLGRAEYGEHLLVYQRVTVGSRHDAGDYPRIGAWVNLYAGATVLGDVSIGDGATVAANATLLGRDVPPGQRYSGSPGAERIVPSERRDPIWR